MKGCILFAFNSPTVDYYKMAIATAKRINKFLDLPVSVVTDENTDTKSYDYNFDNVFVTDSDKSNTKEKQIWINKGRYKAFELSPYNETLVLDTDYMVNSNQLLNIFDMYSDFMCHNTTNFILHSDLFPEKVSSNSFVTNWATVMFFQKTKRVEQIFESLKMVQYNYMHYVKLYNMYSTMYRNDYGLTLAMRIVNGQFDIKSDYIPWQLNHVAKDIKVTKESDTSYTMFRTINHRNTNKTEYCIVNDLDFHCLDKNLYMDLVNE